MHTDLDSNLTMLDSTVKVKALAKQCKEFGLPAFALTGHDSLSSVVQGWQQARNHGLTYIAGLEAYFCEDIEVKTPEDRYSHLLLLAKNNIGLENLQILSTKAWLEGFYYKPRIDWSLLEQYNEGLIIADACLGGVIKKKFIAYFEALESGSKDIANKISQDIDTTIRRFIEIVGRENFYFELQPNGFPEQEKINKILVKSSYYYGVETIITTDVHYLRPEDKKTHAILLKSEFNNEREQGEFYDYTYLMTRQEIEDILVPQIGREETDRALNNTLKIAEQIEEYTIEQPPLLPDINIPEFEFNDILQSYYDKYPYIKQFRYSEDENDRYWYYLIEKGFTEKGIIHYSNKDEYIERINTELWVFDSYKDSLNAIMSKYTNGVVTIFDIIRNDCDSLISCGRGCFTKDAIVTTDKGLKPINKVEIGDKVISDDGNWHKVVNTMEYDIQEDLIEFEYQGQGSSHKKYKNICTLDHKVLVNKNRQIKYIEAKELKEGDLLCCPKIQNPYENKSNIIIDLVNYNYDGFDYDDKYIYEVVNRSDDYEYSPGWVQRQGIASKAWALNYANGKKVEKVKPRRKEILKKFHNQTPFPTQEHYQKYCEKNQFITRTIPRYIELDYVWNVFIGLMYGDGWTDKDAGLGLAINRTTKKDFNKYVFETIAQRMGLEVSINSSKNRNLDQLFIRSKILCNWFKTDFFASKKHKIKQFNPILFEQSTKNLRGLYLGLTKSDGSINLKEGKLSFDNISLSIINAYKILSNILRNEPLALDVRLAHTDSRGYRSKESYKVRRCLDREINKIASDDSFWYLPITKVQSHKNIKTKVYDLTVEDSHSYMINNIIVHNSSGAFLTNYLSGITELDPVELDLPWWRFGHPERPDFFDIDFDSEAAKKELIDHKVKEYFGEDKVIHLCTFGTISSRSAILTTARSLDIPIDEAQKISSLIPSDRGKNRSLKACLYGDKEEGFEPIKELVRYQKKYPELFKYAIELDGIIDKRSAHASGKVILPVSYTKVNAAMKTSGGLVVSQLDMDDSYVRGCIKYDWLAYTQQSLIVVIL